LLVKLITGALKNQELMSQSLKVFAPFLPHREGLRRDEPILLGEKSFGRERVANELETIGFSQHRKSVSKNPMDERARPTSAQSRATGSHLRRIASSRKDSMDTVLT
jgi:hypothetical protein